MPQRSGHIDLREDWYRASLDALKINKVNYTLVFLLACLALLFTFALPNFAFAGETTGDSTDPAATTQEDSEPSVLYNGTFASNSAISWSISSDGLLSISGTGVVTETGSSVPWDAYRNKITSVSVQGAVETSLEGWFDGCTLSSQNLSGVVQPSTNKETTDKNSDKTSTTTQTKSGPRRGPTNDPVMHSGTFSSNKFANWSLTRSGVLTISGKGTVQESFGNVPWYTWRSTVTKVVTEGTVSPVNMNNWFSNYESLTEVDLSALDLSKCTSLSYVFYSCSNLTKIIGLANWDVRKVTDKSN